MLNFLLLVIFALTIQHISAQSCPTPTTTYNGTYNPLVNSFDNGRYGVYQCSCRYDANEFYGVRNVGEGYCLMDKTNLAVSWFLVLQTDTKDYKWYPAWDQYVMAAANTNFEANPTCTVVKGSQPMPSTWLPATGYNATQKFNLNQRCNIEATYCSVTGKGCIALSTFAGLQRTAFDVEGVACNTNFNGQPFWGLANVLIQWNYFKFEQCWRSSLSTPSFSPSEDVNNRGNSSNKNTSGANSLISFGHYKALGE